MFYKIAKEICHKEGIDELTEKEKHIVAQRLLYMCFPYGASTGITEETTYGYGNLDRNGFWEFPLTSTDLRKMKAGTL
jgi:hypothetical protein